MSSFSRAAALLAATLFFSNQAVWAQETAPTIAQGKVVSLSGRVEHTVAAQERWTPARVLQPLLTAERVRTLEASRAAILFIDETQVKLNAGAVLTVRQVRAAGGAPSTMELERGEAWFRTKNPRSGLTIQTPAAAAAVRGTEINLRIGAAGETVLTVVEGAAEFFNPQGTLMVVAGEEGVARIGEAPTKRALLNPEDAVQWALYYPLQGAYRGLDLSTATANVRSGFERLRAGDSQAALTLFSAEPGSSAARLGAAGAYVASGDLVAARQELEVVLRAEPSAVRALVMRSMIELRQNRARDARASAERAIEAGPDDVGALIAASEAAQAEFDLDAALQYLDRALRVDPQDVPALVNRARIRFGTDDTAGAREDADRAAALAPDDPQVLSLRGFIRLSEGDVEAATLDFEAAVARDPAFGEPHLGLGLAAFRSDRVERGLEEMLTATLLEPKVSLYQSYLGKAYYQARRFPEGLAALASAKRLDPNDPTPWLYSSFFLRDLNEQVRSLDELRRAIALNDHRAVYRSRLLLDRDLATKNVSLAQIYRQLGFEAWGAFEALNSLDVDLTNSAAHLFMAETYGGLPDRTEALSSELLQYFLYAPVNRNSFNSFSEYTALIEQPRRQLDVTVEGGSRGRGFADITHRSGNERFAHVAFFQGASESGARVDRDDNRWQGFFQGKLSLSPRSDVFVSYSGVSDDEGASETTTRVFGNDLFDAIILRQFTLTPDRTTTNRFRRHEGTVGWKHQWHAGSVLTAAVRYDDLEQTVIQPLSTITCAGVDLSLIPPFAELGARASTTSRNPFRLFDGQIQQASRFGRHQVIVGHQFYTLDKGERCRETISFAAVSDTFDNTISQDGHDSGRQTYVRDEIQIAPWLHATAALAYQQLSYDDSVSERAFDVAQWSPRVGVALRLTPRTVFRAAAFRQLHINLLASSIAPPTVAGFVVARNEFPTAQRQEYSASLEHSAGRMFLAARAFFRDAEVPYLLEGASFIPDADATTRGGSVYLNWIAHERLTVFAEDQFVRFEPAQFTRRDNLARIGVNVIHPRGIFFRAVASHVTQRFTDTQIPGLPRPGFNLADLQVGYEFAGKRGLATLRVTNAFNREFDAIVEGLSIDEFLPRRRAIASLRWRLW